MLIAVNGPGVTPACWNSTMLGGQSLFSTDLPSVVVSDEHSSHALCAVAPLHSALPFTLQIWRFPAKKSIHLEQIPATTT